MTPWHGPGRGSRLNSWLQCLPMPSAGTKSTHFLNSMDQAVQSQSDINPSLHTCDQCSRAISKGRAFTFKGPGPLPDHPNAGAVSAVTKCFPCALRHRPMLRRSLKAALLVGTVLTLLNQGDTLLAGQWHNSFYWKIPLTFCVPLIVATYGALTNSRT